jgi:signal transduction histidine kinase/ActR/RegA family two-component response regulator
MITIVGHINELRANYGKLLLAFVLVFAAFALSGFIGRNVGGTSPAILFAPQGVVLAIFLLMGYIAWPAVALGVLANGLIFSSSAPIITMVGAITNTVQGLSILYVLRRLKVNIYLESTRDFIAYLATASVLCAIVPSLYTLARSYYHTAIAPIGIVSLEHFWIAGLFSVLVVTPLIMRWVSIPRKTVSEWLEMGILVSIFFITNATISLTPTSSIGGVALSIPYFALLFWIALRGGLQFTSLAIAGSAAISLAGIFIGEPATPTNKTIAEQIFGMQVLFIFMSFFFLILSALEERRKYAVSRLKAYTDDLEKTLDEKELDAEAKNEFIAVLGHEIRNPLASLLSSVEILKFTGRNDLERERVLESMEDRIRSMGRILDDIFDISRITRKKMILKKESVRARDTLRRAAESVQSYMSKNKHRFNCVLPDKTVILDADPVRIEQIITNLLYNAAKYTPSGGSIDFSSSFERYSSDQNRGQLVIRVRDTGVGLTEAEQEHIFEPFSQINPKQSLMGGIGLGLTLSKNLVEMHGGTIDVQSDGLGRGSEFIVRLPASIGTIIKPEKVDTAVALQRSARSPQAKATKILVVDDNVDAARGLSKLLGFHGHDTSALHHGKDVIKNVPTLQPDVIVLDIGMPDMDGYEIAKKLRDSGETTLLIALSGYGQDDHRKRAREAGFDYYLTKPISVDEVLGILAKKAKVRPLREAEKDSASKQDKKRRS